MNLGPLAPWLALALTVVLLGFGLRSGLALRLAADLPNERSLHDRPVPRVGGLAIMPAMLLAWLLLAPPPLPLMGVVAALALASFADDRHDLPVVLRLALHVAAAVLFLAWSGFGRLEAWAVLPLVLAMVWMTNLYNFMDGADGLAGGMALFGFGALAAAAALAADPGLALVCAVPTAAAAGFLWFNFPPARLFMGDAGSIPLGFAAAALGLEGWQRGVWPALFPILVFSPFIVDATLTLLRRMRRGEPFWRAHKDHYYQRLVRMGWSHRRLALREYALMAAAGSSSLLALGHEGAMAAVTVAWCAIYALIMIGVDRRWHREGASC
ncbi:MAG: glycosyltransferase family 4 protein [Betaproteobacteria bacterium]|nr:glycosyltransferase family 4 protein [Betaproteobacteria bacterium]